MFVQILNKARIWIVGILFLMVPGLCFAAGTAKVRETRIGKSRFITWAWTSDAAGDVSGTTLGQFAITTRGGIIYGLLADPESGVTAAYDVTVQAAWNIATEAATRQIEFVDVTSGDGTDLSNSTNGQYIAFSKPFPVESCTLTITVANAGNATSGTFILLLWEE